MKVLQRILCLEIDLRPFGNMRNLFVFIAFLPALVAPGKQKNPQLSRNVLNPRIIGGVNATLNSNSHMVALIRGGRLDCGGSIISADYILTAAHCIMDGEKYIARVGSLYWFKDGTLHTIRWTRTHPQYDNKNFDVGLMKPDPPFEFNTYVAPIALAGANVPTPVGKTVQVTGWGMILVDPQSFPNQLQTVNVTVITNEQCEEYYPDEIKDEMICAGDPPGKDACFGDSGGPLFLNGVLYGVVSWGPDGNCASENQPYGVYASVAKLRGWIDEETTGLEVTTAATDTR